MPTTHDHRCTITEPNFGTRIGYVVGRTYFDWYWRCYFTVEATSPDGFTVRVRSHHPEPGSTIEDGSVKEHSTRRDRKMRLLTEAETEALLQS